MDIFIKIGYSNLVNKIDSCTEIVKYLEAKNIKIVQPIIYMLSDYFLFLITKGLFFCKLYSICKSIDISDILVITVQLLLFHQQVKLVVSLRLLTVMIIVICLIIKLISKTYRMKLVAVSNNGSIYTHVDWGESYSLQKFIFVAEIWLLIFKVVLLIINLLW